MADRLQQLLGVAALAAMDRLRVAVAAAADVDEPEAGALVHLQAYPGATVNELASVVGRSQPATVRLVDRLAARDLVRRDPGPDRRTVALVLTAEGDRLVGAALAARHDAMGPLLDHLTAEERTLLEGALDRVVSAAAVDRPQALHACRMCDRAACATGPGCPLDHTTR